MVSLFSELKRRNIFRVAVAYTIVAWLLIQIIVSVETPLHLPDWADTLIIVLLIIGFPIALIFAWAFELTPEGIKTASSAGPAQYHTRITGQQLNYTIMVLLVLAVIYMFVDNYILNERESGSSEREYAESVTLVQKPAREQKRLPNSIAVLPFDNLSPDPNNTYFAAGIHDTLLHELAKIRDLNVIARTTMLQYGGGQTPISEVARMLNVETVMEGTVQYAAGQVRITAQLIDPDTGVHLWSGNYDRPFDDIFTIQTEIAVNIAQALEAELLPAEHQNMKIRPTNSSAAYALYLKAKALEPNIAPITQPEFYVALNQATELDPDFALAHATLAFAYGRAIGYDNSKRLAGSINAHEALVRDHAAKALAIDPKQSLAYGGLAMLEASYYHNDKAQEYWTQAIEVNPDDTEVLDDAAIYYAFRGQLDRADRIQDRINELDPAVEGGSRFYINLVRGDFKSAAIVFRNLSIQVPPNLKPITYSWSGLAAALEGDVQMAQEMLSQAEQHEVVQQSVFVNKALQAYAYARAGMTDEAIRLARELLKSIEDENQADQVLSSYRVFIYLALGDMTNTLHWLNIMVNNPGPTAGSDLTIFSLVENYLHDPVLDKPEFLDARNRLRITD